MNAIGASKKARRLKTHLLENVKNDDLVNDEMLKHMKEDQLHMEHLKDQECKLICVR